MTEHKESFIHRLKNQRVGAANGLRLLMPWTLVALVAFFRPFQRYFLPQENGFYSGGDLIGADFVNVWTGVKLALAGQISRLYDAGDYLSAMRGWLGAECPSHYFSYPPQILLLAAVFGLLPYFPALFCWSLSGLLCFAAALRTNRFCKMTAPALALAALSPAALFNIVAGQNGFFTAALFLGGFYLCEAAPLTAGVLFGVLTVKPHLGLLIPFALLLRRNWKCFGATAVTACALVGLSLALWGLAPWQAYMADAVPLQTALLSPSTASGLYTSLMPGPYADAAMVLKLEHPWLLYAPAALFALFVSFTSVRREGFTPQSVLVLAIATFVVLPYGFNYDMVMVAGALVVYLAAADGIPLFLFIVLGMLWALPLAVMGLKHFALPLSGAILFAALGGLYRPDRGTAGLRPAIRLF